MVKVAPKKIDLRRGIDHIGVTVNAVIHDGKGHILLMKRGKGARDEHGRWDVCGGAVEFGELIENAIKREILEELCVEPINIKFLTVYDAHRQHNGNQTHWIALCHTAQVDPDKVKIGEPHKIDEIGWFSVKELPSPLHSQIQKALKPAIEAGILH